MFFFLFEGVFASVMSAPRKVYVVKTKYFDILYSDLSKPTADLLLKEADALYEQAMDYFGVKETFRMPVIISPDSDTLSISYSPSPYNRIVLYDGVPEENQFYADNAILQLFYEQVLLAVNESMRSPFVNFLHKIISSDAFQPIVLLNMPFSFRDAIANEHLLDDRVSLQILSQAKLEGEFPTWFQVSATRDIEPGEKLSIAAGTAFMAYLQQRWGFEKYAEFWKECSKLSVLFTAGIFHKVYGVTLDSVWKEFEEAIPLPASLENNENLELKKQPFFWNDKESRYDSILTSEYGIIWYDSIRHEVDIFDYNSPIKTRTLLFLGDSIEKMTLSPDGRYLSVSFDEYRKRSNFIQKLTKVFDLKEREYITDEIFIRDAAMVTMPDGRYGIAGLYVSEGYPELRVYSFNEDWNIKLEFQRAYNFNTVPYSLVYAGENKIGFIVNQNKNKTFCQLNFADGTEKNWNFGDILITNLKYNNIKSGRYTFQYVPKDENAFTRMGYIELSSSNEPEKMWLQTSDLMGGIYSPVFSKGLLYFSSHKLYYDELIVFPAASMPFSEAPLAVCDAEYNLLPENVPYLANAGVKKYNPIKYWAGGSVYPLLGVVDFELDKGVKLWPGLGFTYKTQTDPFESTEMLFSGVYKFAQIGYSSDSEEEGVERKNQIKEFDIPSHRDFSFTGYVKNTSTPIDIEAAALFDFDPSGGYDFTALTGVAWNIPLGLNFRKLRFNIQGEQTYSTDYYDSQFLDKYPVKCNWVNFVDSYQTSTATIKAEYENMNQYGLSTFENRGYKIGTRIYSFWDAQKIQEYDAQRESAESEEEIPADSATEFINRITQLNVGLNALVAIPRMTPLQMNNGWILSVPGTMFLELMGENGTALETYGEMLLIGKEVQNGFPMLYLYFNRFGLKAGYNLALKYNLEESLIPDLRSITNFYDVFENTYPSDSVYLKFDVDFVSPIGKLSSIIFKGEAKVAYHIRTNKFSFNVNVDVKM